MKNWNILSKLKTQNSKLKIDELINLLLENRNIKTKKEKDNFLNPRLEEVTIESVGIDKKQLAKALKRINQAIKNKEEIVIFGDYDVDGITGAAILWETLHDFGAKVLPHIPHRIDEGYGLSVIGIENAKIKSPDLKLIITDDNGIVAYEAVDYANRLGIDVIITDNPVPGEQLPTANPILHSVPPRGAGTDSHLSN